MPDVSNTVSRYPLLRLILGLAGVAIILAAMRAAAEMVNLVLLGFLICLLALPVFHALVRRGIRRGIAYLLTLLLILLVALIIVVVGLLSLVSAAQNADLDVERFRAQTDALVASAAQQGISVQAVGHVTNQAASQVIALLVQLAANSVGLILLGVFALLIAAFMLAEADSFSALLRRTVGATNPTLMRVSASTSAVITYMSITALVNFIIAVGDVILLWVLGVPNPLLWGVVSFVFGFIPYIGYWVSFLPPFILAFGTGGASTALFLLIGYALINGVVSQILAPRMYGKGLNMSITLTLVAVLFWGWLLGPIGGILAVPMTAIIKSALLASFPETEWLATVLGNSRDRVSAAELPQPPNRA